MGRVIAHNTVDIQGGVRNMVNCFVHETPLIWKDRKHEELTGYDRVRKTKRRKQDYSVLATKSVLATEAAALDIEMELSAGETERDDNRRQQAQGSADIEDLLRQ